MAKENRVPKEGDRVRTPNVKDEFVVVAVREYPNVVDLDLLDGQLRIKNIPWTVLTFLDEDHTSEIRSKEAGY